ncbi:MAG: hypothetical protein M1839_003977 [Geoglossum umbratile]|nr:MAG: hypothetical protein M1839_003977 [Geoglossum umbratile]
MLAEQQEIDEAEGMAIEFGFSSPMMTIDCPKMFRVTRVPSFQSFNGKERGLVKLFCVGYSCGGAKPGTYGDRSAWLSYDGIRVYGARSNGYLGSKKVCVRGSSEPKDVVFE